MKFHKFTNKAKPDYILLKDYDFFQVNLTKQLHYFPFQQLLHEQSTTTHTLT